MRSKMQPETSLNTSRHLVSLLVSWLVLRVVLSVIAVSASSARPNTPLEKSVAAWPISAPISVWVQRVVVEPWRRWDVEYYEYIAERGYRQDDGTLQFHPLYSWLGRIASVVFGGNITAGLLAVSSIAGLLFLFVFARLAEFDLSSDDSKRASTLFLHAPLAFILFAPYSEALFLLFSALLFLMARRGSWWIAGAAGGLAALTRQQGVFLALPLALELWEWCGRDPSKLLARWRSCLSILLIPAGLLVWVVYRAALFGDVAFEFTKPRTWIYGLLISSDASKVVTDQRFDWPWNALAEAFRHLDSTTTVVDLILGGMFIAIFVAGGRYLWRLRKSYFFYAATILLVSFSYSTGFQPYMGLPRHCLLAFPLFLPVAVWARRPRVEMMFLGIGFLGLAVLTYCYAAKIIWLP